MMPRNGVSNLFLLCWSEAALDEIVSHANGSTFLEISKSCFRPISVTAPPEPVMTAFDHVAQPLYRKIVSNDRESRNDPARRADAEAHLRRAAGEGRGMLLQKVVAHGENSES
jgi:type I restriction enzyme S subunit